VRSGIDPSIYSAQLFESGGALDDLLDPAQKALMENRGKLEEQAATAVEEAVGAKVPGAEKMAGKMVGGVVSAGTDYASSPLAALGGDGSGFMRTANVHVTMTGASGVSRSIVLATLSSGVGEDMRTSAARLLRPAAGGGPVDIGSAPVTDSHVFLRAWNSASAPARRLGKRLDEAFRGPGANGKTVARMLTNGLTHATQGLQ